MTLSLQERQAGVDRLLSTSLTPEGVAQWWEVAHLRSLDGRKPVDVWLDDPDAVELAARTFVEGTYE